MTSPAIVVQLPLFTNSELPPETLENKSISHWTPPTPGGWPDFVQHCPVSQRYLALLGPLRWSHLAERPAARNWHQPTIAAQTLAAAELIKLNEGLASVGRLHRFLCEHPVLIWLLGFPLGPTSSHPLGFNARASLPTPRHLTQMLRDLPNSVLQQLLTDTVQLILAELAHLGRSAVECISLDTKHILAWVKENNPKTYVPDRFNKDKQPPGDPDCKLGCKRRK